VDAVAPDLDRWVRSPAIRVAHRRESDVAPERLWRAARELRLRETRLLGALIRWRIPGTSAESTFEELFRNPPFLVLAEGETWLLTGLVGRIWTLRRDYPLLGDGGEFRRWAQPGTAKVVFGHWVEALAGGRAALRSETRVIAFGAQGSLGLSSVGPLVRGFQHLVGSEALAAAVRRAEGR